MREQSRRRHTGVRAELSAVGSRPRKALGQHFLCDLAVADRIVELARPRAEESLLEIGPGLGVLSDRLAALGKHLVLIELDAALAGRAAERYASASNVEVIHGNAIHLDLEKTLPSPCIVVGNLPYNVATAILQRLLEQPSRIRRIVAMVQKEVAQRLVANAGTRAYGALSVLTQFDAQPTFHFVVPAGAFTPPPRVESAVVTLDVLTEAPVRVGSEQRFRRLVRMAFQHRRKQLFNCLRGVITEPRLALTRAGIDGTRRPETLTIEEFASLERESTDA